jgi:hypothetical protein
MANNTPRRDKSDPPGKAKRRGDQEPAPTAGRFERDPAEGPRNIPEGHAADSEDDDD